MTLYVESSAARHLLLRSDVTDVLDAVLVDDDASYTCDLTVTELHRLGAWSGVDAADVDDILARFNRVALTPDSYRRAGLLPHLPGSYLRSLDALHLVAALDVGAALVTYDRRQARAAAAVGLRVVAPGLAPDWYSGE